jgi:SNF2 family DNA or RNA helicase
VLGGMFASHGWPTLRLDGSCSVKQRQALVDTFNNPQVRRLAFLNSRNSGTITQCIVVPATGLLLA